MALQYKVVIPEYHLPPQNPFFPGIELTLITDDALHRTRGFGVVPLDDRWIVVYREATSHGILDGAVYSGQTRGAGELETRVLVYTEVGYDCSPTGVWLMDANRIGVMITRVNAATGFAEFPAFAYSDDSGATWNSAILNTTVHGNISCYYLRYPSSLGGADVGGWLGLIHQSRIAVPVKDAYALYTLDNGLNWTATLILAEASGVFDHYSQPDEPRFVRVNDENKWIIQWRESDVAFPLHNVECFHSTNLLNWSGPFDTGQNDRANGGSLDYNEGSITWLAASRPYHYDASDLRGIPTRDGEVFQGIVTQTVKANVLWDNPAAWPGWDELFRSPHLHGDPKLIRWGNSWTGTVGLMEGPYGIGPGTTKLYSQIAIMTPMDSGAKINTIIPGPTFGGRTRAMASFQAKQGAAFVIDNCATSPFSGLIDDNAAAHGGQGLDSTHVPFDNFLNHDCLKNLRVGANRWGRFILHNTTRGTSRNIVSYDDVNDYYTTEDTADAWADNDVITLQSQTNLQAGYMDTDLSDELDSRETVVWVQAIAMDKSGAGVGGRRIFVHPYEAYANENRVHCNVYLANEKSQVVAPIRIIDQKITVYFENFTDGAFELDVLASWEYG